MRTETDTVVWNYEKLLSRINQFVFEDIDVPPTLFKSLADRDDVTCCSRDEFIWLQLCSDWLKRMIQGKISAGVLYHFYKINKFTTTRKLASKMSLLDTHVSYWLRKYEQLNLICKRDNRADKRTFYYTLNENLMNIHKIILELVRKQHGEENLKSMFSMGSGTSKSREKCKLASRKYYSKKRYLPTDKRSQHNVFYKDI